MSGRCRGSPTDECLPDGSRRPLPCSNAPTRFGHLCESCWGCLSEEAQGKVAEVFLKPADPNGVVMGTVSDVHGEAVFLIALLERWQRDYATEISDGR